MVDGTAAVCCIPGSIYLVYMMVKRIILLACTLLASFVQPTAVSFPPASTFTFYSHEYVGVSYRRIEISLHIKYMSTRSFDYLRLRTAGRLYGFHMIRTIVSWLRAECAPDI